MLSSWTKKGGGDKDDSKAGAGGRRDVYCVKSPPTCTHSFSLLKTHFVWCKWIILQPHSEGLRFDPLLVHLTLLCKLEKTNPQVKQITSWGEHSWFRGD